MTKNTRRKTINHEHYRLYLNTDRKEFAENEAKRLRKYNYTVKILKNTRTYEYKYDVWVLGNLIPS